MERSQMDYDVYVGMDVGKCEDYVVALARDGDERLIDSPVSQSECLWQDFCRHIGMSESTSWHRLQLTVLPDAGCRGPLAHYRYLASSSLCFPSINAFSMRWLAPVNSAMRPW